MPPFLWFTYLGNVWARWLDQTFRFGPRPSVATGPATTGEAPQPTSSLPEHAAIIRTHAGQMAMPAASYAESVTEKSGQASMAIGG